MIGGHGLYLYDLFVAIVAADRLYLKVNASTRPSFEAAGCEPFVYQSRGRTVELGFWSVPAEAMDSAATMLPWARLAAQAALTARRGTGAAGPDRAAARRRRPPRSARRSPP
jgi:DNA transformation protein